MSASHGQAGYTLNEMLVALLIVGLTMGAVMQASALIAQMQRHAQGELASFGAHRDVQQAFADLMQDRGPFTSMSQSFQGDADGFRFDCGGALCGARLADGGRTLEIASPARRTLALGPSRGARFSYVSGSGSQESWPVQGRQVQRLAAIELSSDASGSPAIVSARIWRQDTPVCAFDAISRQCRETGS